MGTRTADYTEYIDITTGTVRRKRTGMLLRDSEDIFIVDPNITIPKNKQNNFLSKTQNDLTINSEKPYYFAKTSLQSISEPSTEQLEYFTNAENFSLSPTNTLAPITFLNSKAKLPEDKQLTVKNKDSLTAEAIITVESPEIVVITERDIDQSSQILKPKSDLEQGQKPPGAKAEIAIEVPLERIENEIVEFNKKDLLRNEVEQKYEDQKEKQELVEEVARVEEQRKSLELEELARQEERRKKLEQERRDREAEKHRLELEKLAKEEEARTKQKKLKEYYDKHNAEVLARTERQKQEEAERVKQQKLKEYYDKHNTEVLARAERQKREEERQKQLQKFKEYQEQQVREVLIQLGHKKQRLTEVLDKLKEGVVSLELANKQATKLLAGGFFLKEHLLVREAKKTTKATENRFRQGSDTRIGKIRRTGSISNWNN